MHRYDEADPDTFTLRWRYLHWGAWSDVLASAGPNPWHWTPHQIQYWIQAMSRIDDEMIVSLGHQISDVNELNDTIARVRPEWPGWQPAGATEDHLAQEQFEYPTLRCIRIADDLDWERNR